MCDHSLFTELIPLYSFWHMQCFTYQMLTLKFYLWAKITSNIFFNFWSSFTCLFSFLFFFFFHFFFQFILLWMFIFLHLRIPQFVFLKTKIYIICLGSVVSTLINGTLEAYVIQQKSLSKLVAPSIQQSQLKNCCWTWFLILISNPE